jgi:hypothetical protein
VQNWFFNRLSGGNYSNSAYYNDLLEGKDGPREKGNREIPGGFHLGMGGGMAKQKAPNARRAIVEE